ncbi:hypothetical protein [Niastella populi]|uniref:Uncharacterized protein n=1 Tax=Niastella populi TaxID=550983 RepID=A0A1V9G6H0_9BACT|nr:hypothetical protein [Niastella populi]OQP66144.1 hypothetical protein A4R26_13710 [Niastella populi]
MKKQLQAESFKLQAIQAESRTVYPDEVGTTSKKPKANTKAGNGTVFPLSTLSTYQPINSSNSI